MKTAITLAALFAITTLQAYAAPSAAQAPLTDVPMSVAKRLLDAAPTQGSATATVQNSGVPMRVAARMNQALPTSAGDNAPMKLSGVLICHARRT